MDNSNVEITSQGVNNITINVDGKSIDNLNVTAIDIKMAPNSLPQIILTVRPINFRLKGEAEIKIAKKSYTRNELGELKGG